MPWKPPAYPKELTDKWWQSNKGMVAKIKTKNSGTGLGQSLTDLQAAFAKLDFTHVDFEQKAPGNLGSRSPDDIKVGTSRAAAACKAADVVSDRAKAVEKAALHLGALWKAEPLIPKSSVEATTKIAKAAKTLSYALAMGTLSDVTAVGIKAEQAARAKNNVILRKALAGVPAKLDALADEVQGVTADGWVTFYNQNIRFIGTQSRKLKEAYPNAVRAVDAFIAAAHHPNAPTTDVELKQWSTDIARESRALRAALV